MVGNFKDFNGFAQEIARIENAKADYVAPQGRLHMVDADHLGMERVGEFGLTDNGHRQLAAKV